MSSIHQPTIDPQHNIYGTDPKMFKDQYYIGGSGVNHDCFKIIGIFNHKGGVGKTTTTANLAWKLARKGHRTLIVDADPQCNITGFMVIIEARHYITSHCHLFSFALYHYFVISLYVEFCYMFRSTPGLNY